MNNITYRKATLWDAVIVTKMWADMMDEVELVGRCADREQMDRFLVGHSAKLILNDYHTIIAEDEREYPVGFVTGYIHYYEYGSSKLVGTCDNLYVRPLYRTSGGEISLKLVDRLIEWVDSMGAEEYEFLTKYNEREIKVWQRRGYTPAQVTFIREIEKNGKFPEE